MKNEISQGAKELSKERKFRKEWQKIATALAALVVFCTTYALILPAITMEKDPVCGFEAHEHGESCYTEQTTITLHCSPEIPEGYSISHSHEDICYDADGNLICTLVEMQEHIHSDDCYTAVEVTCELEETEGHTHGEECTVTNSTLICNMEEVPGHIHGDDCFVSQQTLTCTLEENEEHAHVDECYTSQTVQVCELEETEGHTHSDECYLTETQTICSLEESEGHIHSDACTGVQNVLSCGKAETVAHQHDEGCLATETAQVMTCELPVHVHEDTCYPLEEEESSSEYLCAAGEHSHIESCYDEEGNLICTIPEHIHSAPCVVADYDKTADVETAADWEATLADVELTGDWAVDVLAIAESQLGYQESERNVILTESGDLKGYTRYGAWYGIPYGDWCAMFVSFCLEYAQVEDVPLAANCATWIEELTEEELYRTADAYTPKPGDLIFFDWTPDDEAEGDSDHVGLVVELIAATEEEPAQIKTIEGNAADRVDYVTYALDDPTIIGYGQLPQGDCIVLSVQGEDYTVTVRFDETAGIPETAQLSVREIAQGTEEYDTYYQQAVGALMEQSDAQSQQEMDISFARFFDIHFLVDGVAVAPAAPVDIQIRYDEGFEMDSGDVGQVVHFADDGIEILDADTSSDSEKPDTFRYTQDSFSVSGTIVTYAARAASNTATTVDFNSLDGTGSTQYVIYTEYGSGSNKKYYAITAHTGDVTGHAIEVEKNSDGTITWNSTDNRIFWTFERNGTTGNSYYVYNDSSMRYLHAFDNSGPGKSDYGTTTAGRNPSALSRQSDGTFIAQGNTYYTDIVVANNGTVTFNRVSGSDNAARFYLAAVQPSVYHVWFDGTDGGMMSYYGSDDTHWAVDPSDNTITLPETWKSPTKYPYKLNGWYDINNHNWYAPGSTATITGNTVFYADWVAATYDVGQDNEHTVDSLDTSDFITTYVFDYNALFNVLSQTHTGTISATDHSETWTILNNGQTVPYNGKSSLGFAFVDYDNNGEITYANGRDNTNISRSVITDGILNETTRADLLDLLFNPDTSVIGKNYVGTGNYLFQYMDSTTENYDGEHDGYYYLDARLNAASYNQKYKRFYLYDYLERTSDSAKDGAGSAGQYSDFLPFNSPYIFNESDDNNGQNNSDRRVDYYTYTDSRSGWEYDAKDGENDFKNYNSTGDAATNYFFGIRTDIEFFLPNDAGTQDEYGNYGNISTRGEHMVFDFHGDDDVWVFVDGELLLDIGGLHGIMHGRIDFSTGTISYGADGNENTRTFQMSEGTHTMTVYYMERGSSQSNCAIYFNIAPRYDLEITKEDIVSAEKLDGAQFTIFTCEDCANTCMNCAARNCTTHTEPIVCQHYYNGGLHYAELWDSKDVHKTENPKSTFTVTNGVAKCWGISAGKTYYIRETTPPPGYPESDDLIRITLNNRGTATIETTTLHGSNGVETEGFAVIKQDVNDTLKIVALTVTNQHEGDTTEVRVEKTWAEGSTNLPESITVYLTADGVEIGRRAVLTEENGWSYTWTGLPKYKAEGIDEKIIYQVQEVQVPGYITTQGETIEVVQEYENGQYVDWVRVGQMSDSKTYLLVHNGRAMTYDKDGFDWMAPSEAEKDESLSAQWTVTTDHDGFHLKNGLGYTLTFDSDTKTFYATANDDVALNQVVYYLNSRLVFHDHDVYYQFGTNGTAVFEDGLAFTLYQKEVVTGWLTNIINEPVAEEDQTFVEVTKQWEDGNELHTYDSVTVRLYADGQDTGLYVVLKAANNWTGRFDDLPYFREDGTTVVKYTVVEDAINGYAPEYSEPTTVAGPALTLWKDADSLTADSIYRFTNGSHALAAASDGDVIPASSNTADTHQQWKAVRYDNGFILQNVGSGAYLSRSGNDLTTTRTQRTATNVTISNGYLMLDGSYYLEIGSDYARATQNSANISNQKITYKFDTTGQPGVAYTVTNRIGYALPRTGSMGTTSLYTFGGLLIFAAAIMCINKFGRKRQKGGRNGRT